MGRYANVIIFSPKALEGGGLLAASLHHLPMRGVSVGLKLAPS